MYWGVMGSDSIFLRNWLRSPKVFPAYKIAYSTVAENQVPYVSL